MEQKNPLLDEAYTFLGLALDKTKNQPLRIRELSLAITKMEEAVHWFQAAYRLINTDEE